jgi:hypothetical protein
MLVKNSCINLLAFSISIYTYSKKSWVLQDYLHDKLEPLYQAQNQLKYPITTILKSFLKEFNCSLYYTRLLARFLTSRLSHVSLKLSLIV